MFDYEPAIWKRFVKDELPWQFYNLEMESPEAIIESIKSQYEHFKQEIYELAADHDPANGVDNWRSVELVKQVNDQNFSPADHQFDPNQFFKDMAETYKPEGLEKRS